MTGGLSKSAEECAFWGLLWFVMVAYRGYELDLLSQLIIQVHSMDIVYAGILYGMTSIVWHYARNSEAYLGVPGT